MPKRAACRHARAFIAEPAGSQESTGGWEIHESLASLAPNLGPKQFFVLWFTKNQKMNYFPTSSHEPETEVLSRILGPWLGS